MCQRSTALKRLNKLSSQTWKVTRYQSIISKREEDQSRLRTKINDRDDPLIVDLPSLSDIWLLNRIPIEDNRVGRFIHNHYYQYQLPIEVMIQRPGSSCSLADVEDTGCFFPLGLPLKVSMEKICWNKLSYLHLPKLRSTFLYLELLGGGTVEKNTLYIGLNFRELEEK